MSDNTTYKYFLYEEETVKGPFYLDELINQNITGESTICYEGGEEWYSANQFPEINEKLSQNKPEIKESINITEDSQEQEIKVDFTEDIEKAEETEDTENAEEEIVELPKCINHPDIESFAICSKCLQDFCEECISKSGDKFFCANCKPKGFWAKLFKK